MLLAYRNNLDAPLDKLFDEGHNISGYLDMSKAAFAGMARHAPTLRFTFNESGELTRS